MRVGKYIKLQGTLYTPAFKSEQSKIYTFTDYEPLTMFRMYRFCVLLCIESYKTKGVREAAKKKVLFLVARPLRPETDFEEKKISPQFFG